MAISKRRRQAPIEDVIPESIFDALAANDPSVEPQGAGGGTGGVRQGKKAPSVEDLMKQLADMQTRLDTVSTAQAMPMQDRTQVQVQMPEKPIINLDNLPDPLAEPKEYAQAIATRTIAYQNDMAGYQDKVAKASKPAHMGDPEALFKEFAEVFPDYADNEAQLRFATSQAVERLGKKGVDIEKYMFTQSDRFFKDVTKEFDNVFGKPLDDDSEDAPAPRRNARSTQSDADQDEGRTEGIFGGGPQSQGRRPAKPEAGDMIKDLHDVQRKSGYY